MSVLAYLWRQTKRLIVWYFADFVLFYDWFHYQSNDVHAWVEIAPQPVLVRATERRCAYVRDRAARELTKRFRTS